MPGLLASNTTTDLNFLSSTVKEKPFFTRDPAPGEPETNIVTDAHPIHITDLRGLSEEQLKDFTIDTSGFQIYNHESKEKDFVDEETIKNEYYPEVEQLLKDVTGASRVIIFDHTIRRRKHDAGGKEDPSNRGPGLRAHVDQTPKAGRERVFLHAGDDAEKLSKGRVQIINVWRPIRTVEDAPLAYADYRSIDPSKDLAETDLVYPHRRGETYTVNYNPNQKWYYYSHQSPNEVVLLKCYESEIKEGRALLTPHSAFVHPDAPKDAPPRQSIEVRTLVFYE